MMEHTADSNGAGEDGAAGFLATLLAGTLAKNLSFPQAGHLRSDLTTTR
jgi:hypothetical protein